MRRIAWIFVLLLLCSSALAATREQEPPDPEMLRMMDLLREWDMIKNLDLMRQLGDGNRTEEAVAGTGSQKNQPRKTKDQQK